jgi:hypothetical protein
MQVVDALPAGFLGLPPLASSVAPGQHPPRGRLQYGRPSPANRPGSWRGTGTMTVMAKAPDRWHRWLMDTRSSGDPARERLLAGHLYPVRDTVLDKARLQPGDTVLDVGTGDG